MGVKDVREDLYTAARKMPVYRNRIELYVGVHLITRSGAFTELSSCAEPFLKSY